ncbi:MAG TPA: flagellar type III secretion system pore protein FliP [Candidatus Sulfotelmatobacter sp.]|nr:flagellar type III secretion system pore protein FliP [Candidatus Sulfotelmatobacter sp.]
MNKRILLIGLALSLGAAALLAAWPAAAQSVSLDLGEGGTLTGRIVQLVALLTVLSLAPSILIVVTSFTRIIIVLSLLRSAIGVQTAPPNVVLISLALFLTGFIMQPTFERSYHDGIQPLIEQKIDEETAFNRTVAPVHQFMIDHVHESDLKLFMDMGRIAPVADPADVPLRALIPAFMISEIKRAFEIGFLIFIPFIVIDMVVASLLMSMGMMMLPPAMLSLPFKLIFFVLVDGWTLIAGSLVKSFGS